MIRMQRIENWFQSGLSDCRFALRQFHKSPAFATTAVLTLALGIGAPLDNNLVERALKKAVLHRKNSLFYKTENGAQVGDLFMSLIHTCELNGANAFDYLIELQKHAEEVAENPSAWMPWNCQEVLAQADTGSKGDRCPRRRPDRAIVVLRKRFVLATGPVATNSSYPDHRDKSSVRRSASARWSAFWSENDDGDSHRQDHGGRSS